jgi:hypothetical protein
MKRRPLLAILRLTAGVVVGLIAVFVLGIALYADQADPIAAREAASRTLQTRTLEEGEIVERVLPVYRRRVWDYYTATHGLLVATDRRILFIGLPPTIRASSAREGEPPLIEEVAFTYEDVKAATGRVFLGRAEGIVLQTSGGRERFGIDPLQRAEADSLVEAIARRQVAIREAAARERAAREEAARRARAPVCHVVRRGEALERIAARYDATVAELEQLNGLKGSRIRAGETLLVRRGSAADAGGKRCELPPLDQLAQWGFASQPPAGAP